MAAIPPDEFKQAVYDLTRFIPRGRVSTYGAIARGIGASGASRRVGWALNQCFGETPPVPAHRVVNRLGLLTGAVYFPAEAPMAEQLRAEGVEVVDDQVVGFDGVFWDPWEVGEWLEMQNFGTETIGNELD